ncbi:hypothetical protein L6164_005439 [Bauhinia variegata]|uniref:Uncharacterized protein n=1 Tax=Bauhinia variegata TaxID=167791 RepID=A0ACB9PRC4_BAUVA|nr:hypothetical protein L6164_005439 [Bauhinia variegata]
MIALQDINHNIAETNTENSQTSSKAVPTSHPGEVPVQTDTLMKQTAELILPSEIPLEATNIARPQRNRRAPGYLRDFHTSINHKLHHNNYSASFITCPQL